MLGILNNIEKSTRRFASTSFDSKGGKWRCAPVRGRKPRVFFTANLPRLSKLSSLRRSEATVAIQIFGLLRRLMAPRSDVLIKAEKFIDI
jgi:hypothetical protein